MQWPLLGEFVTCWRLPTVWLLRKQFLLLCTGARVHATCMYIQFIHDVVVQSPDRRHSIAV